MRFVHGYKASERMSPGFLTSEIRTLSTKSSAGGN